MDRAEVVVHTEGETWTGVMASLSTAPGVEDPIALYKMLLRQPGRSPPLFSPRGDEYAVTRPRLRSCAA